MAIPHDLLTWLLIAASFSGWVALFITTQRPPRAGGATGSLRARPLTAAIGCALVHQVLGWVAVFRFTYVVGRSPAPSPVAFEILKAVNVTLRPSATMFASYNIWGGAGRVVASLPLHDTYCVLANVDSALYALSIWTFLRALQRRRARDITMDVL